MFRVKGLKSFGKTGKSPCVLELFGGVRTGIHSMFRGHLDDSSKCNAWSLVRLARGRLGVSGFRGFGFRVWASGFGQNRFRAFDREFCSAFVWGFGRRVQGPAPGDFRLPGFGWSWGLP